MKVVHATHATTPSMFEPRSDTAERSPRMRAYSLVALVGALVLSLRHPLTPTSRASATSASAPENASDDRHPNCAAMTPANERPARLPSVLAPNTSAIAR